MLYETIKRQVASHLYTEIKCGLPLSAAAETLLSTVGDVKGYYASLEALADKAYAVIMAWDVRCVGRLRTLFPQHFPKALARGALLAKMRESDSEWVVIIDW